MKFIFLFLLTQFVLSLQSGSTQKIQIKINDEAGQTNHFLHNDLEVISLKSPIWYLNLSDQVLWIKLWTAFT